MKDRLARLLAPLLLFATAVGVRALPWPTVITEKMGIQPFGKDAYYHLRRIQYAAWDETTPTAAPIAALSPASPPLTSPINAPAAAPLTAALPPPPWVAACV